MFVFTAMLLIEALLVLQEFQLPGWFLPHHTAHDVVSTMHRLFPAFMNGCRCITTAFHVERKAVRVEALEKLAIRYVACIMAYSYMNFPLKCLFP